MPHPRLTRSLADSIKVFAPALLLTAVGFVVAYQFVDPAPPQRFVIATAGADGAYHRFAMRYRDVLARDGVELEVVQTAGSVENLARLRAADARVQVAFVQGGVGTPAPDDALVSLASLYFEPLWVFYRTGLPIGELSDLRARRGAVGAEGSGTRAVALQLLGDNAISPTNATLQPLGGSAAAQALAGGQADAVFVVGTASSPAVQALLRMPGVSLLSFARADAYTRLRRHLSRVTLPRGVIDLARDIPAHDVVLLATAATLVARRDFHPALIDLLMQAAASVHRPGEMFEDYGQFPSPRFLGFPPSEEARRFFESGPSFLRRVLSFWAATLIERMLVMLSYADQLYALRAHVELVREKLAAASAASREPAP